MAEEFHYCERCNRRLKSAKAIEAGMGAVCKRKSQEAAEKAKTERDPKQST